MIPTQKELFLFWSLSDQTDLGDVAGIIQAVQAEGIKGDHLNIPVNKLFRHKKSQPSELDQCK